MRLKSSDWRWVADWLSTFNIADVPRGRARQAVLYLLAEDARTTADSLARAERAARKAKA